MAEPGCLQGWPFRRAVEGEFSSTVIACEREDKKVVHLANSGSVVAGLQVAAPGPRRSLTRHRSPRVI
jgi:hypothetical protein